MGTRESLFTINVLIQRCIDINVDIYMDFTDYQKTFEEVRPDHLLSKIRELQRRQQR